MSKANIILSVLLGISLMVLIITRFTYTKSISNLESKHLQVKEEYDRKLEEYKLSSAIYRDSITVLLDEKAKLTAIINNLKSTIIPANNEQISIYFNNSPADSVVKYWTRRYSYFEARE